VYQENVNRGEKHIKNPNYLSKKKEKKCGQGMMNSGELIEQDIQRYKGGEIPEDVKNV
jgi:hypothetical protein